MRFSNSLLTDSGKPRASVNLRILQTLWINTGTLCNLACDGCYIKSSPTNDALVYISKAEVEDYLTQIEVDNYPVKTIGFTGGEPFMNPEFIAILELVLEQKFDVLVLTNAMRPMAKQSGKLLSLQACYGSQLSIRVSMDHFSEAKHEKIRGARSWAPMIKGLKWLSDNSFDISIAARTLWGESEKFTRKEFAKLFAEHDINVADVGLLLFPEMDGSEDVPEITSECWGILDVKPENMMCATSRMVVKLKGDDKPSVTACTLLPYEKEFNYGYALKGAVVDVKLNHPHCARFCVLGGASCGG